MRAWTIVTVSVLGATALPPAVEAQPAGSSTVTSSAECPPLGETDEGDVADADGSLVVLVDGTVSSAGQADRVGDLVELVDDTTSARSVVLTVGSFGGSDAEVRFTGCLDGELFVPDGNNARTRERNRPALVEGLAGLVADLPSGHRTSDPTSALRAGVARLGAAPERPRVLVMHTDGIATSGCAALPDEVVVDDPAAVERLIDELVGACAGGEDLPDATGVEVVIGGIGRTADALSADAVEFLLDLNTALCEATGATCHVDPNLPGAVWPTEET